jgi:hypothetical protein
VVLVLDAVGGLCRVLYLKCLIICRIQFYELKGGLRSKMRTDCYILAHGFS